MFKLISNYNQIRGPVKNKSYVFCAASPQGLCPCEELNFYPKDPDVSRKKSFICKSALDPDFVVLLLARPQHDLIVFKVLCADHVILPVNAAAVDISAPLFDQAAGGAGRIGQPHLLVELESGNALIQICFSLYRSWHTSIMIQRLPWNIA